MKKILIIYTGGTVGMVRDAKSKTLKPFDFEHLLQQVLELNRFNYQLDSHSFNPLIDSSNMQPPIWIELVKLIEKNYNKYHGFVILHGTDTMAYTASALSFMLENLNKAVVLTGSQLPIGEIRTDAKENLITAIEIAASESKGNTIVPEVCIFFDYQLLRGNRATKYSSAKFEAFRSVNYPALAEAGVHIKYDHSAINDVHTKQLKVHTKLDTNIAILKIFPGISQSVVDAILNSKNLKAVVLETYGSGNASTDKGFIDSLKKAIDKGIIVLDVTQCLGGKVELGRYETSAKLKAIGVTSGADTTTEAAVTKLMFLLGQNLTSKEVKRLLETSLRGEIE